MTKTVKTRRRASPSSKTRDQDSEPPSRPGGRQTKLQLAIDLISRPEGASLDELVKATGWQRHSTRGALAGALRKKLGSPVIVEIMDGVRRYHTPNIEAEG